MNKPKKWIWWVGAIAVLWLVGTIVQSPEPPGQNVEEPAEDVAVAFTISAQLQASQLTVNGQTDLLDGAVVRCEATYQGAYDDNIIQNHETLTNLGTVAVSNGAFTLQADVGRLPPGQNKAFCVFMPTLDEQPQSVYEAYGETGQLLTGDNVESSGGMGSVRAESFFDK